MAPLSYHGTTFSPAQLARPKMKYRYKLAMSTADGRWLEDKEFLYDGPEVFVAYQRALASGKYERVQLRTWEKAEGGRWKFVKEKK